ncbi:MAG: hypothetical protein KC731_07010 [Myxococcales bacterium]|nr:hypothetical protein [Myxococcales bacterium]
MARLGAVVFALLGVWVTGCRATPPAPAPEPVLLPAVEPTPVTPDVDEVAEEAVRQAACKGLSPCTVLGLREAGVSRDSAGRPRRLVALLARDTQRFVESAPPDTPLDHRFDGHHDDFGANYGACTVVEAWRVHLTSGGAARSQLLTTLCNDGHGAAGVGEDRITVDGGRLTHEQRGGSAWRWSRHSVIDLGSGLLEVGEENGWTFGDNAESVTWDHVAFRGAIRWRAPRCGPSPQEPGELREHAAALLPHLELDPDFSAQGWRRIGLGDCATVIDAEHGGFVLAGEPSVRLRLLGSGDQLFVELEDDDGPSGDQLEIWYAERALSYFDHCLEPPEAASGIAVALGTGRVTPLGARAAPPAVVEVEAPARSGAPRRLALRFATRPDALTLVYRDVDGGAPQGVLATSRFDPSDRATLGRWWPRSEPGLGCRAEDDVLQRRVERKLDRPLVDTPFVPGAR